VGAPFSFSLPPELSAKEPPERRGIARDDVRLLVIDRRTYKVEHSRLGRLGEFLRPGDLLVFNSSRTLPASLGGCTAPVGPCMEVRLAEHLPDGTWLALLLCQRGDPFECGLRPGMRISFGEELSAKVHARDERIQRLWRIEFSASGIALLDLFHRLGRPIRYEHVSAPWTLDDYQTVYARDPGSAEMPSAGRAFTWRLLFELRHHGIDTVQVVLHTGLSSYMDDELDARRPVSEEEYFVGEKAAAKIDQVRQSGNRVIAVGTTVVRALETVADAAGRVEAGHGYTRLHLTDSYRLKAVDGLLTGLHEPEASHLDLLTAFLPAGAIQAAYEEAVRERYLWHEFGDLNLIL
jgi:S-adenosylmethionine:tRNA ribosyltransferase-isomerase